MSNVGGSKSGAARATPIEATRSLEAEAQAHGGQYEEPAEYAGSFGRTLFDENSSKDGTVTVVFPSDKVSELASQSLIRIHSVPDDREYIAAVTSGPFCQPDGLSADAPQLVVTAVRGMMTVPRHHGRLQASIIGQRIAQGIIPARHRPRPNSAVHLVPSEDIADFLNFVGDFRLGLLHGHDDVEVRIDPTKKSVLPRHSAHIGTTGGGKSTGVGRTIYEMQKAGSCVVVFDVEGEYAAINRPTDHAGLTEALKQRGLVPDGVPNTHLYRLCGCQSANPEHPSSKEFSLAFEQISPFMFGEIMDLTDAQTERLFQAYEIGKALLRELDIFPSKKDESHQRLLLDIDEFDRGWPLMRLEDMRYLVSAIIGLADKAGENEPPFHGSNFYGKWSKVRQQLIALLGGEGEDERGKKRGLKLGNPISWKALMARLSRLQRLKVFDRGPKTALNYEQMLLLGRVNIVDLSDLENNDVRNLAISEILRGILEQQQVMYDKAYARATAGDEMKPLLTNVIIEEAHEFLSARRIKQMPTVREQLMKIAKRGRKRYLGLTFVTQSPNDLPDDVLGLVNNWVIYKIDETTTRRIKSYVPSSDDSIWGLVRGLGPGQALVSFTTMRRPVIAAIDPSPAKLLMTD